MSTKIDESGPEPRRVPKQRPGPVGGKRDENRRRRTRELCDAGLELFLERGIENVTIDEIVGKAGVAKGSFYRYFRDKGDLVTAIFSGLRDDVEAAFVTADTTIRAAETQEALSAGYEQLAQQLGAAILGQPKVALLYLQESRAPAVGARKSVRALADRVSEASITLTGAAREHGLLRPIDPRISANAVVGAVEKLLFAVLSGQDVGDALEIPHVLISMVLEGLRPQR